MKKIMFYMIGWMILFSPLGAAEKNDENEGAEVNIRCELFSGGIPYVGINWPFYIGPRVGVIRGQVHFSYEKWKEEYPYPPPWNESTGKIIMGGLGVQKDFSHLSRVTPYIRGEMNGYFIKTTFLNEIIKEGAVYLGMKTNGISLWSSRLGRNIEIFGLIEGGFCCFLGEKEWGLTYNAGAGIQIKR